MFESVTILNLEDFCRLHRWNCRSVRLPDTGDTWVQALSINSYREIRSVCMNTELNVTYSQI